ncbi:MAG: hypothetical protein H6817_02055 [Phycisphaerales bacterium]|nr:hypothetical protein [Phycisphaerales bacterium]
MRQRNSSPILMSFLAAMVVALTVAASVRAGDAVKDREAVLADALAAFDRATGLAARQPDQAASAYRESARLFESLVADGVENGRLYYDLGNAYLQLGELGKAILNYRRAERLIGNDPQLQANLHFARSLCRNQIDATGGTAALRTAFFWHYDTSLTARFWVAFGAYVIFWGLLALRSLTRAGGLGYAALALCVVWVSAGASVGVETWQHSTTQAGVTVADDIVVRKGNGDGYEPQFAEALHEGVEFVVVDERPGWYKVELADGSTGWLKQSEADLI